MSYTSKNSSTNGWLVVDKNEGYTSTSIVNKVKWLLNVRKAGHAGTLDPDATGILAIALGEATKTIPYLTEALKSYQFQVFFGASTDTDDLSGRNIKISDTRPTDSQLKNILKDFTGIIKQVPPNYSAVKLNGKRAYELSRSGSSSLTLKARDLLVEKLEIVERIDINSIKMKMVCGKGGYVRSIARDIGEKLGCYAHAGNIRRLSSGPFTLANSISSDIIFTENIKKVFDNILPSEAPLNQLKNFNCVLSDVREIKNGKKILIQGRVVAENTEAFVCYKNKLLAIGKVYDNYFFPKRVFSVIINE